MREATADAQAQIQFSFSLDLHEKNLKSEGLQLLWSQLQDGSHLCSQAVWTLQGKSLALLGEAVAGRFPSPPHQQVEKLGLVSTVKRLDPDRPCCSVWRGLIVGFTWLWHLVANYIFPGWVAIVRDRDHLRTK